LTPVAAASSSLARRLLPGGTSAILAVSFLTGVPGVGQERPVFRTEAKLVVLHALVRNKRGELVTTLPRDAFTVYENGKAQTIALFHRDDVPVSLGLLIDNSGSMHRLRAKVEAAALACVRASNPKDEVFVLNFADKPHIDVSLTADMRVLEAGIARLDSIGGTAMRDAIVAGADYLNEHSQRDRRVLLVITDGVDNASLASINDIRSRAERHEILVYAIGLLGEEEASKAAHARHELDQVTALSGGVAYYPAGPEELNEVALRIAQQIRNQYTIGYTPPDQSLDGSYRSLRVVARGPERLLVLTRPGYRATAPPTDKPQP
jgi:Ca-activated chloride channel family protein